MKLEHLMDFKAKLYSPVLNAGKGPYDTCYIYRAGDGSFEGARLKGRVLPGGGDMPITDAGGTMHLDIRVALETDDGAHIYLQKTKASSWVAISSTTVDLPVPYRPLTRTPLTFDLADPLIR